jgi:hypothetical protein
MFMVWYKLANPNQTTTSVMEQRKKDECHKKHSLIESGWTNQQDMGKVEDNIALSLSETQARMIMRCKMQPASY